MYPWRSGIDAPLPAGDRSGGPYPLIQFKDPLHAA
jgi:hypothetical protein